MVILYKKSSVQDRQASVDQRKKVASLLATFLRDNKRQAWIKMPWYEASISEAG